MEEQEQTFIERARFDAGEEADRILERLSELRLDVAARLVALKRDAEGVRRVLDALDLPVPADLEALSTEDDWFTRGSAPEAPKTSRDAQAFFGEAAASLRRRVLEDVNENGPVVAPEVAVRLGCSTDSAYRRLRELEGRHQIAATGLRRNAEGVQGPASVEFAPLQEPSLERVRDWVRSRGENHPFTVEEAANAMWTTTDHMGPLLERLPTGMVVVERAHDGEPTDADLDKVEDGPTLMRYVKPTSAGAAAQLDARGRPVAPVRRSEPVAGTGRPLPTGILRAIERAGATVESSGNTHWIIRKNGHSVTISNAAARGRDAKERLRKDLAKAGITVSI